MTTATPVTGTWSLTMRTPIGTIAAQVTIVDTGGVLSGEAVGRSETVPLQSVHVEPEAEGHRLTWRQSITRPMRLNLDFDVLVVGDVMTGTSRAGRLPSSAVTGRRTGTIVDTDHGPQEIRRPLTST
jgi:hypothetical protein